MQTTWIGYGLVANLTQEIVSHGIFSGLEINADTSGGIHHPGDWRSSEPINFRFDQKLSKRFAKLNVIFREFLGKIPVLSYRFVIEI